VALAWQFRRLLGAMRQKAVEAARTKALMTRHGLLRPREQAPLATHPPRQGRARCWHPSVAYGGG
jgi:hypothetical protein